MIEAMKVVFAAAAVLGFILYLIRVIEDAVSNKRLNERYLNISAEDLTALLKTNQQGISPEHKHVIGIALNIVDDFRPRIFDISPIEEIRAPFNQRISRLLAVTMVDKQNGKFKTKKEFDAAVDAIFKHTGLMITYARSPLSTNSFKINGQVLAVYLPNRSVNVKLGLSLKEGADIGRENYSSGNYNYDLALA